MTPGVNKILYLLPADRLHVRSNLAERKQKAALTKPPAPEGGLEASVERGLSGEAQAPLSCVSVFNMDRLPLKNASKASQLRSSGTQAWHAAPLFRSHVQEESVPFLLG